MTSSSVANMVLHPAPKTVHQALAAITAELPSIGKGDKSPEGYQYRGIEAVTKHLQPLLAKHGVVIAPKAEVLATVPSPAMKDGWQDVLMRVEWSVYGPDGTHIEAVTNGIGRDRSDKGANKAQTQAYKYLLLHLFCIADGKDDTDDQTYDHDRVQTVPTVQAKGRLLKVAGGDKEAAAAAWDKAGLTGRSSVTADEEAAAVRELHELGWSWAPNDAGGAPDSDAGDTPPEPADAGRADMDTPPAPSPNAAGQHPPVGLNARQVALKAGVVFKADYDAAPKGQKTRTADRLARHGQLQRGLRSVLAHHLVFHANRAGLAITDQTAMACLALNIVFALPGDVAHQIDTEKDVRVTDLDLTADELRTALAESLVDQGAIKSAPVEAALRKLPRHLFLPGVELNEVYGNVAVYTKADATGASISAASQPIIVVHQLEQLDLQPGETVFEAGAGTGINAGYMALIVGPEGKVYTVDFDSDIVDGARKGLANAGIENVEVILGDGALGLPQAAPFNKIIATVGAHEVPSAWLDQLAPGGRLVVPVRLRGTASRSIAFERIADRWRSVSSELCVFMPLRGTGDDARRYVDLAEGVTLQVHKDQHADPELLATALDTARYETWTGVVFGVNVSFEWMELWLSCTMPNSLMRMNVQKEQPDSAKVTPMFGWGSMATVQDSSIAYLTLRKLEGPDGNIWEVGVIGHGPDGSALADEIARQVTVWEENFRGREARFEMSDYAETADPSVGRFVLDRPHHAITVIWD